LSVGWPFETVTIATGEVFDRPFASVVSTASQWLPLGTVAVFQASVYGALVTIPPNGMPSMRYCTPVVDEVDAVRFDVPVTVARSSGESSAMVGSGGSTGTTVSSTWTELPVILTFTSVSLLLSLLSAR